MPTPKNVTELKSFLGMINYYSKFIKVLPTLLSPLHNLLKKGIQFVWDNNCSMTFDEVKRLLKSDKVLTHYIPSLPVTISCDASEYGIGAVISHKFPDSSERPISFASRTLTNAEKNYSIIHKEAVAIVWGITKFY